MGILDSGCKQRMLHWRSECCTSCSASRQHHLIIVHGCSQKLFHNIGKQQCMRLHSWMCKQSPAAGYVCCNQHTTLRISKWASEVRRRAKLGIQAKSKAAPVTGPARSAAYPLPLLIIPQRVRGPLCSVLAQPCATPRPFCTVEGHEYPTADGAGGARASAPAQARSGKAAAFPAATTAARALQPGE